MASLSTDRGGLRRILVSLPDGTRPAIRLGRMPIAKARGILGYVERLEADKKLDGAAPDPKTAAWLTTLGDTLRDRLAEIGLAPPRAVVKRITVADLVAMLKARPRWQQLDASTIKNYEAHFEAIVGGLGAATAIEHVTEAAAENLRAYLTNPKPNGAGLAIATASRTMGSASTLFRFASRSRLLPLNPFQGVKQGSMATSRKAFVDDETSRKVLDALQGTETRLLFALARWGGLRTPSEQRVLRWGDIDWERNRFTVNSPKSGPRVVPIFAELAGPLSDRFAEAAVEEFVLPYMAARSDSTFSSHVAGVVRRQGLDTWPRCSTRCVRLGRRSSRTGSLNTWFAGGWGIRPKSPSGITSRPSRRILRRRANAHKIRRST